MYWRIALLTRLLMYRLPSGPTATPEGPDRSADGEAVGGTSVACGTPVVGLISYTALSRKDVAMIGNVAGKSVSCEGAKPESENFVLSVKDAVNAPPEVY